MDLQESFKRVIFVYSVQKSFAGTTLLEVFA